MRLDILAIREQVPHGWVTGDDELGRHTRFRGELRARGERYVLGVPCTTTIRDLEAPVPAYQGRGRRPKAPWQAVTTWRQALHPEGWTRLTVRDGEKGPVEIEMVKRRVQTRLEWKRMGPQEWLVVTRRPLADAETLEARASRDATDQDAHYRYHYYLTPTQAPESELAEPSLTELARMIKGSCTATLRIIPSPPKPGKMPHLNPCWRGTTPWCRIMFSRSSSCSHSSGFLSSCTFPSPSAR